jgi:Zn-dependent peptidase ImmA (M78 family)
MAVDEFTAVNRARELVAKVKPNAIPVPVEAYVAQVGAVLRRQADLEADEPGWSFENNGKHYICVNSNERPERQRFTICHELAHIVLRLPSDHKAGPWWSYAKRSPDEICCDVFAAELLLPYGLFKPLAEKTRIGLASVENLASRFAASNMATGSRYATVVSAPCAFVISERGKVRYAARSAALRDASGWISPRMPFPSGSVSEKVRTGVACEGPEEIDADLWLNDWSRGGMLLEEARHLKQWDQTLTLLWFEAEEIPSVKREAREEREELGLEELDGVLPWPGRKRRK